MSIINVLSPRQIAFHDELETQMYSLVGVHEVEGAKDHPWAVLAHITTGIVSDFRQTYVDEVPWCSSGMTLMILQANMKLNPSRTVIEMKKKKFPDEIVRWVRDYAGVPDEELRDTGFPWVPPTFNASADSYFDWGVAVGESAWRSGLVVGLTRDGGNHVSMSRVIDGRAQKLVLTGCNQSNSICTSDTYSWSRLRAIRAAAI